MRYRGIGPTGAIISALSLSLAGDPARSRPGDWIPMLYAAFENGICGFDVREADAALLGGISQAFAGVDRRLAFVAWRLGAANQGGVRDFSVKALLDQVRSALSHTGLQYLDAVLLDEPPESEPRAEVMGMLEQLKSAGLVRFVGVAGESDAIDAQVSGGGFDLLATPFNLTSGWRERHRLRAASASDTAVIGYRFCPSELRTGISAKTPRTVEAKARKGWDDPLAGCGTYAFLEGTPGWKADEICLAYALTEPCLASVQVRPASIAELERLAAVVERDMPPGLAAQIEMARFSPQADAQSQVPAQRRA